MSQVVTFLELLGKLEAGGSPFSRMKTLSEFWRFLAGLDRKQRLQLSKTLGLDQGEQILERFLANPGTRASEMLSWIETVLGTLDPGQAG
jgi:hypothetical protein